MKLCIAAVMVILGCLGGSAYAQSRPSDSVAGEGILNEAIPVSAPFLIPNMQWTYRRIDLWTNQEIERFNQTLISAEPTYWVVRWHIPSSKTTDNVGSITTEALFTDTHGFDDARMVGRHESLRFPLEVGKTWSFAYKFLGKKDSVTEIKQTAKVKGWETITVPAGRFRAMRVEHDGRYSKTENGSSWGGRIQEVFWYSPIARRIVANEYRDTTGAGAAWDQRRDELMIGSYK
ncbi:MAG: hypothetical protein RLY95_1375 [Pseudomonadota bacterium]|jgi:hypothetical protein